MRNMWRVAGSYLDAFGYFKGKLYIADRHHADILERLVENEGHSWEDLLTSPPVFGWMQHTDDELETGEPYSEDYSYDTDVPRNKENPITVRFATDSGAPKPTPEQEQEVLKAIEKQYKVPAEVGYVDMSMWDVGAGYGADSSEYNLHTQQDRQNMNPEGIKEGDKVQTRDGIGTVIEYDPDDELYPFYVDIPDEGPDWYGTVKKVAAAPLRWLYSPDYDRYQEWPGEMSHPEVARDIWQADLDTWKNMWGGLKHPDGRIDIGWWPLEMGTDEDHAKRNAPLELLQHLQKNR